VRPERVARPDGSVAPGLHVPEAGSHRVVWWDPNVLRLAVEESVGLRQQKILEVDASGARSDEGRRAHDAWQAARARMRDAAATPSLRVASATGWAATASEAEGAEVTIESVVAGAERPRGKRFGALVHAVLAVVDLRADRAAVAAVAEIEGRLLGAPRDEVEAASEAVAQALAHPVLVASADAAECRREAPITHRRDDGTIIEGVVDLAYRDRDSGWTVVDFKTDGELSGRLAQYRAQVALYAQAIARATGEPTRGVLLRV
jgi:ATP-dependent exoDNAse (exonuclease V) beta subunit